MKSNDNRSNKINQSNKNNHDNKNEEDNKDNGNDKPIRENSNGEDVKVANVNNNYKNSNLTRSQLVNLLLSSNDTPSILEEVSFKVAQYESEQAKVALVNDVFFIIRYVVLTK